ncbi:DUF6265 family protein [candidate division KSB1 bacterium]
MKEKYNYYLKYCMGIPILFSFIIISCQRHDSKDVTEELIQVDSSFSEYSAKYGMTEAFLNFSAEDAVLLRSNYDPIKGTGNISSFLKNSDDSTYTISWKPQYAKVSNSGELGFTYGIYKIHSKDNNEKNLIGSGTYVSIWEKDMNGEWKYILDTGNEGLNRDRLLENIQKLKSIIGNWYFKTENGIFYEQWKNLGDTALKGFSFLLKEGDTAYFENIQIEIIDNEIVYVANVSDQNKGKEIIFKLTESKNGQYIFLNPEHDFPQRIIYNIPVSNDSMHARIEGIKNENELSSDYYFKRLN